MIACRACESYNRGAGRPACLKCEKYKEIKMRYSKRQTIRAEIWPQELLDQLPDESAASGVMDAIRQLPPESTAVIVLRYYAGLSYAEIGVAMRRTERAAMKLCALSRRMLKTMVDPPGGG